MIDVLFLFFYYKQNLILNYHIAVSYAELFKLYVHYLSYFDAFLLLSATNFKDFKSLYFLIYEFLFPGLLIVLTLSPVTNFSTVPHVQVLQLSFPSFCHAIFFLCPSLALPRKSLDYLFPDRADAKLGGHHHGNGAVQ